MELTPPHGEVTHGEKDDLSTDMVDAAREVMKSTKDAEELRRALSVVLSGVLGPTFPAVAEPKGRSRATVVRLRKHSKDTGVLDMKSARRNGAAGSRVCDT